MSKPERCPFYIDPNPARPNGGCNPDIIGEQELKRKHHLCTSKYYVGCDIYVEQYLKRQIGLPLICPICFDCEKILREAGRELYEPDKCQDLDLMEYVGDYRNCPVFSKWFYSGHKLTEDAKNTLMVMSEPVKEKPKEVVLTLTSKKE